MTITTKLTDTHLVILSYAAQHPEGRALPLPYGIGNPGGAGTRGLKSLLRRKLLQEEIARPEDQEWVRGDSGERLTLTITPAGLAAIGVSEIVEQAGGGLASEPITSSTVTQAASQINENVGTSKRGSADMVFRDGTKGAAIVKLLRRKAGATLPDLMAASGWQAHSVRGFLSGTLRKKHGLIIASDRPDGTRRYRIAA